jgi:hypothetical protein
MRTASRTALSKAQQLVFVDLHLSWYHIRSSSERKREREAVVLCVVLTIPFRRQEPFQDPHLPGQVEP